jgi:hypothetical protein
MTGATPSACCKASRARLDFPSMYLTAAESRALSRLFGLLAEDMAEHEVRERVGYGLLDLLRADYFASYVWDDATSASAVACRST